MHQKSATREVKTVKVVSTLWRPHSTLSRGHQAEEESSGKDSDQKRPASCPEALNQGWLIKENARSSMEDEDYPNHGYDGSEDPEDILKNLRQMPRRRSGSWQPERKEDISAMERAAVGTDKISRKGGLESTKAGEKRQDRFALLTKTPKEILALDKGKFKPPPPMATPVEKKNASKFCEFYGETGVHLQNYGMNMFQPTSFFTRKSKTKWFRKPHNGRVSGELKWAVGASVAVVKIGERGTLNFATWMKLMVVRSHSQYNGIIEGQVDQPLDGAAMISGPEAQLCWTGHRRKEFMCNSSESPKQTIAIGSTLTEEGRKKLCDYVSEVVFALDKRKGGSMRETKAYVKRWKSSEMRYHERSALYSWLSKQMAIRYREIGCNGGILLRISFQMLSRCIQGIPSNKMEKEDEEKTAFITSQGIFCYSKMPFRLKNACVTYQRLVDKAFQKQIGLMNNNEAEYEVDSRIKDGREMGVRKPSGNVDSDWWQSSDGNRQQVLQICVRCTGVEELKEKSINAAEVLAVVEEEGDTWMTPIFKYLSDGTLPAKGKKARAVKRKSWRFSIINGILYKKSFLGPWLRCVGPLQANYVLREIHKGSCSMHASTRSVVANALRIGYY
ncbi:hypothetical protein Tco_1367539 [Tanacetum coccineum]